MKPQKPNAGDVARLRRTHTVEQPEKAAGRYFPQTTDGTVMVKNWFPGTWVEAAWGPSEPGALLAPLPPSDATQRVDWTDHFLVMVKDHSYGWIPVRHDELLKTPGTWAVHKGQVAVFRHKDGAELRFDRISFVPPSVAELVYGVAVDAAVVVLQRQKAASVPVSRQSTMRRFVLERAEDLTGTSGTGMVAEGVVFSNGHVAYSWISPLATVTTCQSLDVVERLHGHGGRTTVRFLDERGT